MRRVGLVAAVAGTLGLAALSPASATVTASSQKAASGKVTAAATATTFGVPRIVDPIHTFGEPDIKVAPNGDIHVSGPQGTGVQRSIWNVSKDNGDSWRVVNGIPANPLDQTQIALAKTTPGPGGGDTELAVARNGKVFYDDLYTLTCFTAATSTDGGATVQTNPLGCSTPVADRQWYALFDPPPNITSSSPYTGQKPLLYLTYNDNTGAAQLDQSTDGLTFTSDGVFGDGTAGTGPADGNLLVDQQTGDVLALVSHSPTDPKKEGLSLAVGVPDATGKPTFSYHVVTDTIAGNPTLLFPVMAQDAARNLYAVWAVDADSNNPCDTPPPGQCYHVFYSYASAADGWTAWSPPKQIDTPPAVSNIMPTVTAGAAGIVDVAWYGTNQRINPSDQKNQAWDVYMAQLTSANSAAAHIEQVKVTPHPMHYNDICLQGTGCITQTGNRNLADFFQITIDNDGRARVVYNDTSNGLIQPAFAPLPGFNGILDHSGAAVVTVATQSTGINSTTGQPLAAGENTTPVGGVTDPAGDALFKPIGGTNVPGADITNTQLSLDGGTLHVKITIAGDSLSKAADATGRTAADAVVRWQMGNVLYYAAVEEATQGGAPTYYAGATQSIDLCSVSACNPHYLVYPAPPAGGTSISGSKAPATATGSAAAKGKSKSSGKVKAAATGTTYDIAVPVGAVGNVTADSLLEEVAGFVQVSPVPAAVPITNVQADAELVPLQIEGTKTFNFQAATVAPAAAPAPAPAAPPPGKLPATGTDSTGPAAAGALALSLVLVARFVRRRRRITSV